LQYLASKKQIHRAPLNHEVFFFLLLCKDLLLSFSSSRGSCANQSLVGLGLLEGKCGELNSDSKARLVGVGDAVGNTGLGRDVEDKTELGQALDSLTELGSKNIISDIQHLSIEKTSVVIDTLQDKTVGEGANAKLLKKSSLRSTNLFSGDDEVGIVGHLNLTLGNLGGDLKGLEEVGLSGVASGGTLGDDDINGSNSSNPGRSRPDILVDYLPDVSQVTVGEDETNISTAKTLEAIHFRVRILSDKLTDDLAHHGVLSHEDLSSAAEGLPGVLQLPRSNVVNSDNKGLGVAAHELLHLTEVLFFAFFRERHDDK